MFVYYFLRILGSPGVAVHELSHAFFCFFSGVKVHKIKLFQFGETAGYVSHDEAKNFIQAFFISFGPLLINTFLALFLFSLVREPYFSVMSILYFYLGLVISLHAIPSTGDAKSLLHFANHKVFRNPLVLILYPLVLILYILNLLKRIRLDILYSGALIYLGRFYL